MMYLKSLKLIVNHPLNRSKKLNALARIFWWKFNQMFLHLSAIVEIIDGKYCVCMPENSYGGLVVYTKLPEYYDMVFARSVLRKKSVFLDVGSGIGDYALVASSVVDEGKIIAFEPSRKASEILKLNIALNRLENLVSHEPVVVGNKGGFEYFADLDVSEVSHIGSKSSTRNKVESVRLDKYLKSKKIAAIDLLKIDVEGAEGLVLTGLGEYLDPSRVKNLIVEINKKSLNFGYSPQKIIDLLTQSGYKTFAFDADGHKEPVRRVRRDVSTFNVIATA